MFSKASIVGAIVAEYLGAGADLIQIRAELNTPWLAATVAIWKDETTYLPWGGECNNIAAGLTIEAGGFVSVDQERKYIMYPGVTFEPKAHDGEIIIGSYTRHALDLLLYRGSFDGKGGYIGPAIHDLFGHAVNPARVWDFILLHPALFARFPATVVRKRVMAVLGEFM